MSFFVDLTDRQKLSNIQNVRWWDMSTNKAGKMGRGCYVLSLNMMVSS